MFKQWIQMLPPDRPNVRNWFTRQLAAVLIVNIIRPYVWKKNSMNVIESEKLPIWMEKNRRPNMHANPFNDNQMHTSNHCDKLQIQNREKENQRKNNNKKSHILWNGWLKGFLNDLCDSNKEFCEKWKFLIEKPKLKNNKNPNKDEMK